MAVVPADKELNLKALAAASGNHKVRLIPVKDLEKLTGYVRGESRHLALRKHTQSMLTKAFSCAPLASLRANDSKLRK